MLLIPPRGASGPGHTFIQIPLDLSASFNIIDHNILLQRLHIFNGLSDTTLNRFRSQFSDRSQSVYSCDSHSKLLLFVMAFFKVQLDLAFMFICCFLACYSNVVAFFSLLCGRHTNLRYIRCFHPFLDTVHCRYYHRCLFSYNHTTAIPQSIATTARLGSVSYKLQLIFFQGIGSCSGLKRFTLHLRNTRSQRFESVIGNFSSSSFTSPRVY